VWSGYGLRNVKRLRLAERQAMDLAAAFSV